MSILSTSSAVILIYIERERQNFQLYSSAKLPSFVVVEFLVHENLHDNSIDKVRHSCLVFLRSGKITAIVNYGGKKKPLEPEQLTGRRKHE